MIVKAWNYALGRGGVARSEKRTLALSASYTTSGAWPLVIAFATARLPGARLTSPLLTKANMRELVLGIAARQAQ